MRLAALLALLPACSFLNVRGPPPGHEQRETFTCTSSRQAPIFDVAWTLFLGGLTVNRALDEGNEWGDRVAITTQSGLLALIAASGAIYGFIRTQECRCAEARLGR